MGKTGLTSTEIVEKAIDYTILRMQKHGFEKIRLTDVAKDLGVTHAALYAHFASKAELLDAVSSRWLRSIDDSLEEICKRKGDPITKIYDWFLKLHQLKREKVLKDPELYKAFDYSTQALKPFVDVHMKVMRRQVTDIVTEAIEKKKIHHRSPEKVATILLETLVGFSHPKLVVQYLNEKREPLLKQCIETLLTSFK